MKPEDKLAIEADRLFKLKLVMDETVIFPTEYLFKFIVPAAVVQQILVILNGMDVDERASSNGRFISVSAKKIFHSSDEIILIYQKASFIQGIISL
jgi:putative lipoic acid-binding regulatory protein